MATTRNYKVDIELAIERAMKSLDIALHGKNLGNDEAVETDRRLVRATVGAGYVQLAMALQAERDYEERHIQRIAEQARGGPDAEMRPDEPDRVLD